MYTALTAPPIISPISEQKNRPVWSVMIPVYNCAAFLPETLESVLKESVDSKRMQIEVVDDASTGADIASLVKQIGKGRIGYFRQDQNVGNLRNFETCINRASGEFVHLLHGDDRVLEGYYNKVEELFRQYPEAGAAFTRYRTIDDSGNIRNEKKPEMLHDGILQNWLLRIAERQHIQYAAITVRREVYEKLGAFYGITYGEDWEMWVRIARHYPVAYTPDILAEYRMHSHSISGNKYLSGQHLQDLLLAMELIQQHLPEDKRESVLKRSKSYYARYGLKIADRLWSTLHDKQIAKLQLKHALNLYKSPRLYLMMASLYLKFMFNKV